MVQNKSKRLHCIKVGNGPLGALLQISTPPPPFFSQILNKPPKTYSRKYGINKVGTKVIMNMRAIFAVMNSTLAVVKISLRGTIQKKRNFC